MNNKKEPKKHRYPLFVSVQKPLLDAIEEHAAAAGITRSRLMEMVLLDYFIGDERPKEVKDEYRWAAKSTAAESTANHDNTGDKEASINDKQCPPATQSTHDETWQRMDNVEVPELSNTNCDSTTDESDKRMDSEF